MKLSIGSALAGMALGILIAGGVLVCVVSHRSGLSERYQDARFESLGREVWGPRASDALASGQPMEPVLSGALRTPGLIGLRVYDQQGHRLFDGRGPVREPSFRRARELWAPLARSSQASSEEPLASAGMAEVLWSPSGVAGLRVLDRQGRVLAEPILPPSDEPEPGLRATRAPLYPVRRAEEDAAGSVRVLIKDDGRLLRVGVYDGHQRPLKEWAAAEEAPDARLARTMSLPYDGGRLELDYGVDAPVTRGEIGLAGALGGVGVPVLLLLWAWTRSDPGRSPQGDSKNDSVSEELQRANRQRDRFAHALEYERTFRASFLSALARELRAFRASLVGTAASPSPPEASRRIQQGSRVLQSIIEDVEGVTGLPPGVHSADETSAGTLLRSLAEDLKRRTEPLGLALEVVVDPTSEELRVERWAACRLILSLANDVLSSRNARLLRLSLRTVEGQAEFSVEDDVGRRSGDWESDFAAELAAAVGGWISTEFDGHMRIRRLKLPAP